MNRSGSLSIIGAAVLWGCIGAFVKVLSAQGYTSMQIVAIRMFWALLAVGAWMLLRDRSLFRVSRGDWVWFGGAGIVGLAFFNWCYFTAIELSSMAVAAVLLYTAPVFVMIFSRILFGEKLTAVKITALVMTLGGCVLVTGLLQGSGGGAISLAGILVGVCSGLGYALYSIFSAYGLRRRHFLTVTFYTLLCSGLVVVPLADPAYLFTHMFTPPSLLYGVGLGVLCCMLPNMLYTKGLTTVEAGRASVMATLEPVVATLLGLLLFDERMTVAKGCGIALIFGAVMLLNRRQAATQ